MFFYFQLSLDLYVIVAAPYFKTVVRQVSFTLLMTRYCDSNPLPLLERIRRFKHLVHVLGQATDGVKLPFMGLNSKVVSSLLEGDNDI